MRVLIIDNLRSGLRDGAIHDFIRRFLDDGDELTIRSTSGATRIESLLDDAAEYQLVVASGGDSTIATVCYQMRYLDVPVLAFPAGTGNLIATNLNQPEEPHALATMARRLLSAPFDLGVLVEGAGGGRRRDVSAHDAGTLRAAEVRDAGSGGALRAANASEHGFAVMAGAGYDASIMSRSEKLKPQLGPMAYLASAISDPMPTVAHFTITLDDEVLEVDGIAVLIINFAEIFPDFSITHGNDARDGFFEVVVLKSHNAVELLPAMFAVFLDSMGNFPGRFDALEVRRSAFVHVQSDPPLAVQYDGEAQRFTTPFEAHILPGATRLVLSEEEYRRLAVENLAEPIE
ncbi:MAG: hypothetical protein LBP28_05420 [Coriobacteriales bacterium]|jgi:diacylglycerol kinase family enzyme|nr:hypothetical protein [Coriobacteriales bacterium]